VIDWIGSADETGVKGKELKVAKNKLREEAVPLYLAKFSIFRISQTNAVSCSDRAFLKKIGDFVEKMFADTAAAGKK
jgi:hypothetical protein